MARFIPDPVGGLPRRPYKSEDEIDCECEEVVCAYLGLTHGQSVPVPLSTDLLTSMIEAYAGRLDLYADMEESVEGITKVSADTLPIVNINRRLSSAAQRTNRLRSTLAHEFYHLYFHAPLYRERLKQMELFGKPLEEIACRRETILHGTRVDWREWQAAYGAGALLMPISTLRQVVRTFHEAYGPPPYGLDGPAARPVVSLVATYFAVSKEAAGVRLWQKRFLQSPPDGLQLMLWAGEERGNC